MSEGPSETYMEFVLNVYPKISTASAWLAFFVVAIMIGLSIYDFKLVNRVTLRLQTAVSAIDIWTHTTALWFPYYKKPGIMCTFIAWQRFFGPLLYLFLNISIAVNLQMNFLTSRPITRKIEICYWIMPIIVGLIITIPLVATESLGYAEQDGCFVSEASHHNYNLIDIMGLRIWTILTLVYLTIIVILVVIKLNKSAEQVRLSQKFISLQNQNKDLAIRKIKHLAFRLLLYPLVAILGTSGVLISQLYIHITGIEHEGLNIWALISLALTGTMNFIAFLFDPTFQTAITITYQRIRYGYENNKGIQALENNEEISYELNQHERKGVSTASSLHDNSIEDEELPFGNEYTKGLHSL